MFYKSYALKYDVVACNLDYYSSVLMYFIVIYQS